MRNTCFQPAASRSWRAITFSSGLSAYFWIENARTVDDRSPDTDIARFKSWRGAMSSDVKRYSSTRNPFGVLAPPSTRPRWFGDGAQQQQKKQKRQVLLRQWRYFRRWFDRADALIMKPISDDAAERAWSGWTIVTTRSRNNNHNHNFHILRTPYLRMESTNTLLYDYYRVVSWIVSAVTPHTRLWVG